MEKVDIRDLYCKQLKKVLIGPYGGDEEELKGYIENPGEEQSDRFIKPRDQYLSGWLVPKNYGEDAEQYQSLDLSDVLTGSSFEKTTKSQEKDFTEELENQKSLKKALGNFFLKSMGLTFKTKGKFNIRITTSFIF